MNEVYIDIRQENEWIRKYFTTDWVSVKQLLDCIEELDDAKATLIEQIQELSKSEEEKLEDYKWELADRQYDSRC